MMIVDNVTNSGTQSASASYSYSHTCTNAGILIVGVAIHDATLIPSASAASVTYNGVSLTLAVEDRANLSAFGYSAVFYLLNPTTGSNTLAVTLNQAYSKSIVGGISLAGAITGVDNTTSFHTSGTNPVNSITPVAANTIVVDVLVTHGQTPSAANTGQIIVYNGAFGTSGGVMSYRAGVLGANSTSMGWTCLSSQYDQVLTSFAAIGPSFRQPNVRPHPYLPGNAR